MEVNYKEMLNEVFTDICEKLAFMFTEIPDDEEFPEEILDPVKASMTFVGPFKGSLALVVPNEMCPEIAANVLGLDPDDEMMTESAANDALKEMLNVTCGHVLTSIAGEEPVFDLSVPEVSSLDKDAWKAIYDSPTTCALLVDDSPVLLYLVLEE